MKVVLLNDSVVLDVQFWGVFYHISSCLFLHMLEQHRVNTVIIFDPINDFLFCEVKLFRIFIPDLISHICFKSCSILLVYLFALRNLIVIEAILSEHITDFSICQTISEH